MSAPLSIRGRAHEIDSPPVQGVADVLHRHGRATILI